VVVWAALSAGCAVVRYADYAAPGLRLDRPVSRVLPPRESPGVAKAFADWHARPESRQSQYPTPYHCYVDTPAPGTFEGPYMVGLAFSGGGTRGILFTAACINEFLALPDIIVAAPGGDQRIDVVDEVDYVSGVSTGAIPAALYALDLAGRSPEHVSVRRWPDALNIGVTGMTLASVAMRPDWLLRDYLFEVNTRPAATGAIAAAYFGGNRFRAASGRTFGDLPTTPILLLGGTLLRDPTAAFVYTRLPYRFALSAHPQDAEAESFESFGNDPLSHALADACYSSMSYPGAMRSGRLRAYPIPPWVGEALPDAETRRGRNAFRPVGPPGVYEVKDGGQADNRGLDLIARLFTQLAQDHAVARLPLLIGLDAARLELRTPDKRRNGASGWSREFADSYRATWQAKQETFDRLVDAGASAGNYAYVRFSYTAWAECLTGEGEQAVAEPAYLEQLCRDEPALGTVERFTEVAASIGTHFAKATPQELAAITIAARFAVHHERAALLQWATEAHSGAAARFADEG
jgi:predicted acylesterase/phospholipase RssA